MSARTSLTAAACILGILTVAGAARADRRSYVWTYEYMTMWKGHFELEYYLTTTFPDADDSKINSWRHELEVEYGITKRWDISMYQRFKQTNTEEKSEFKYDGFKLRTRYRIADKGRLPIDTLLYLEYIRDADFSKPNVLEGKIILARDFGPINLAYNQIVKQALESGGETEVEYAAGTSYDLHRVVKLGIESKGNFTEGTYGIGPTVAVNTGRLWFNLGALAGLTSKSDDISTRLIVGLPF